MAHYQRTFAVEKDLPACFAYVSDFRHTATWDPMVTQATLVGGEPIRVGTTFEVISKFIGSKTVTLPYTVEEFEPNRRLVMSGTSSIMRYTDTIDFAATEAGTQISYDAKAELTGLLGLGNFVFPLMFKRIGDNATDGIQRAVNEHA